MSVSGRVFGGRRDIAGGAEGSGSGKQLWTFEGEIHRAIATSREPRYATLLARRSHMIGRFDMRQQVVEKKRYEQLRYAHRPTNCGCRA